MALCGLKQVGHEWYEKLRGILEEGGSLKQCIGDEGTYVGNDHLVGTHVDDFLAIGTKEKLDKVEQQVENYVELDRRGRPPKMLGIELHWKKDKVLLTQERLIESLVQQHGVSGVRHSLLLDPQNFIQRTELEEGCDKTRFQQIIGALLFLEWMTRPEISIYVNFLGRQTRNLSIMNLEGAR
jgi:hypothetical protein